MRDPGSGELPILDPGVPGRIGVRSEDDDTKLRLPELLRILWLPLGVLGVWERGRIKSSWGRRGGVDKGREDIGGSVITFFKQAVALNFFFFSWPDSDNSLAFMYSNRNLPFTFT